MARVLKTRKPGKRRVLRRKVSESLVPTSVSSFNDITQKQDPTVVKRLASGLEFDAETYEFNDAFKPYEGTDPLSVHTVPEMLHCLEKNEKVEIDARILCSDGFMRRIEGRKNFLEFNKSADKTWEKLSFIERNQHLSQLKDLKKVQENDYFATNNGFNNGAAFGTVNSVDFTPIMGGPFFKQLYPYDYMRMISACYYAGTHDPVAKATLGIMLDFVMGRGFTVMSDSDASQLVWDAFYKINNGDQFWANHFHETELYGESMIWKLPKNETFISWQRSPKQEPPIGIIPRIRLIDPSCIFDIITFPEDITDVIAYQWVAPTQYQTYTAPGVPTLKFIFTQIPADQVIHVKTNAVSNEKRGRSELFASLGYYKRLRDSVNYSIISEQKNAAWSIDTTVDGNQSDINIYASSQAALGTLPPAGSEFIHSKKITRQYLGNQGKSTRSSNAFDWCMSMIAMGSRVPVSYYGTHLSGGSTRASSIVATEPVAKMFERKRLRIENTIKDLHYWLTGQDCRVIWPELITQDRSSKIRDIILSQQEGYLSLQRSAEMVAKEFNINDYDYDKEQEKIEADKALHPEDFQPLTTPGTGDAPNLDPNGKAAGPTASNSGGAMGPKNKGSASGAKASSSGLTGQFKNQVKNNARN